MDIPFKKTQCSYCGSEYVTEVQYDENFEKFTAASKAAWVGLTDEEIDKAWRSVDYTKPWDVHRIDVARAIEAKLKEKNT